MKRSRSVTASSSASLSSFSSSSASLSSSSSFSLSSSSSSTSLLLPLLSSSLSSSSSSSSSPLVQPLQIDKRIQIQRAIGFWSKSSLQLTDLILLHHPSDNDSFITSFLAIIQPQNSHLMTGIPSDLQSSIYSYLALEDHISFSQTCNNSQMIAQLPSSSPYSIRLVKNPCKNVPNSFTRYMRPKNLIASISTWTPEELQSLLEIIGKNMIYSLLYLQLHVWKAQIIPITIDLKCLLVLKRLHSLRTFHGVLDILHFQEFLQLPSLTYLDIETPSLNDLELIENSTSNGFLSNNLRTLCLHSYRPSTEFRNNLVNGISTMTNLTSLTCYALGRLSNANLCTIASGLPLLTHLAALFPNSISDKAVLFSSQLQSIESSDFELESINGVTSLRSLHIINTTYSNRKMKENTMRFGGLGGSWKHLAQLRIDNYTFNNQYDHDENIDPFDSRDSSGPEAHVPDGSDPVHNYPNAHNYSLLLKILCRSSLPSLQTLQLHNASFNIPLSSFECYSPSGPGLQLSSLTKLDMTGSRINLYPSDLLEECCLPRIPSLQSLNLTDCEGSNSLISNIKFPSLTEVYISSWKEEDIIDLVKEFPLIKIIHLGSLNLISLSFNDLIARVRVHFPHVEFLYN